jgi:hypothetical protein
MTDSGTRRVSVCNRTTERDESGTQDGTDAQQRPGMPTHEKIHDSLSRFSLLEVSLCASASLREFIL